MSDPLAEARSWQEMPEIIIGHDELHMVGLDGAEIIFADGQRMMLSHMVIPGPLSIGQAIDVALPPGAKLSKQPRLH